MKLSHLFGRTLRESPVETEVVSYRLALRAGLVRFVGSGIYCYLPLGWRVLHRIETIIREEMSRIGAQEMTIPMVQPANVWETVARLRTTEDSPIQFRDRDGRAYVLPPSFENVIAQLVRREVRSYRDLPRIVFHIQTQVRDEPRPYGGFLRARVRQMKTAYSLDADPAGAENSYAAIAETYERVFARCGLVPIRIETYACMAGSGKAHKFVLPHPQGEEMFLYCPDCGYAADVEAAAFRIPSAPRPSPEERRVVATPDCATIADVAAFIGVPTTQTLKAVLYTWNEQELVFVLIRGDLEVNEQKLRRCLGGGKLRPATETEIRAVGVEPGYASPVGIAVRERLEGAGLLVVADRSIEAGGNFVAGANRYGYHYIGVNYPRDFSVTLLAEIAQAQEGYRCPRSYDSTPCHGQLVTRRAIGLGYCAQLGSGYAEAVCGTYLDAEGEPHPVVMGAYGIEVSRLMAAIIESHHDDDGITWPASVSPFDVHLVALGSDKSEEVREQADALYAQLQMAGLDVLYDDRLETAGVKFADADLIGVPIRVTVSRRSLQAGGLEFKLRTHSERIVVPMTDAVLYIEKSLREGYR